MHFLKAVVFAVALFVGLTNLRIVAAPAHFWISMDGPAALGSANIVPEAPQIQSRQGSSGTIYIWGRPGSSDSGSERLSDFSLDLVALGAAPVIQFRRDALRVYNPVSAPRFQFVADSSQNFPVTVAEDDCAHGLTACTPFGKQETYGVHGIGGYTLTGTGNGGIGGVCNQSAACAPNNQSPAWLIASLGYDTTRASGTSALHLQIGYLGMQYAYSSTGAPVENVRVKFGIGDTEYKYDASQCGQNSTACAAQTTAIGAPADLTIEAQPPLPGDFSLNGVVDAGDYVVWRNGLGIKYIQADYAIWRSHFTAPPVSTPGDFNGNGSVGPEDYQLWRQSFGVTGTNLPADANRNGIVDSADFVVWRNNVGASSATGSNSSMGGLWAVPEPATISLPAVALFTLALFNNRAPKYRHLRCS